jgi:parallel beta-helix repeat protein
LTACIGACSALLPAAVQAPSSPQRLPAVFWVSPAGNPHHDGTSAHPLDLATALSADGPVRPGDTVWVRGGTYRGTFSSTVAGTADAPIVVRQVPGERATIDSAGSARDGLSVEGGYTWFWGLEITSSDLMRRSVEPGSWPADLRRGYGSATRAAGVRYINLVVHDNANGLGLWSESSGSDAYGNIVYHNGWQGPDRAHGHGIYTQNERGTRRLSDNIVFNQFSHGIHAFGSERAHLDNITLEGNIVFNNGALAAGPEYERNLLLGGGRAALNPKLEGNLTYFGTAKSSGENSVGYGAGCVDLEARDNYLVGGRPLVLRRCSLRSFTGNVLHGRTRDEPPIEFPGNEFTTVPPTTTRVFVRPNRCEAGRAHVAIYNWEAAPRVTVDVSAASLVAGERFVVRDAQNYFGDPVAEGVYDGKPLSVPLTGLMSAPPVGDAASPEHTAPQFGVFVVDQPSVMAHAGTTVPSACAPAVTDGPSPRNGVAKFLGILKSWVD